MKFLKLLLLVTTIAYAGFGAKLKKDDLLSAEEAFQVTAVQKGDVIETRIILGDKIHVTADTLNYTIVEPDEIELDVKKPLAHKVDGDMVYEKEILVNIPLKTIYSEVSGKYTLAINFSGCSDAGICYNPISDKFNFEGNPNPQSTWDKISEAIDQANPMAMVDILINESSFFVIFLFLIMGLLLALTPCIFPMIPILSSIIVSQQTEDEEPSAFKGFFISLIYVLSMAVTYTLVGVISGLLGADIQAAMQSPWVLTAFALMFFALAISLFGYYEIQLPAKWQTKINSVSDDAQGNGIMGTVIMGFLSAFIIGPCVAPPLAGAVIFISQTGDALLGAMALFAMSMGMGLPLLLVGAGAGKFMPRPGGWMTAVSQTFGVVMLALAIFMLGKVVSAGVTMFLWSLLFMGTAFYMGVFDNASSRAGMKKLFQLLAFIFLLYGAILFIGFLTGSKSMLDPLEKFTAPTMIQEGSPKPSHPKAGVGYSIAKLQAEVEASIKPVLVDFRKKSCAACDELELLTFPNVAVKEELKRFTFIKIDVTNNTDEEKALMKKYNAFGTPSIIFFDKDNQYLVDKTVSGFVNAEKFTKHLKTIN
ncbi:MAG: Cytochrome c-type biogenesis protein DsbD, protein-disulfide reductase (EC [uncultured Sulfurovum sp.]|uniref:Cytochrome c-type biogenesis protein DsbD, protein-disulfide reductase (EC) n=1 Tax=uncultured Sulfurovum sp. TaxID=269237 RepID=A0A6S6TMU9_9BACT|nr:MAG: Cytochrome c-type biogenesis protein DsbD, protein-disulfide reductase (EC [uncultured Sulfurovum sp.]